ncbi:MAG: hypothetical protein RR250_05565 [Akkermansia sp.]
MPSKAFPIPISNLMTYYSMQQVFYVICEGKSECAYLQELNKELAEEDIPISFQAFSADNGTFACLKNKWKTQHLGKGRNVFFFADWDLFYRDSLKGKTLYDKEREKLPRFYFNHQNFEDFFSLHLPFEKAAEWCEICIKQGHFKNPMCAKEYEPLFQTLVPNYQKGKLPSNFNMHEGLAHLRKNLSDHRLHQKSEFAVFLLTLLEEIEKDEKDENSIALPRLSH